LEIIKSTDTTERLKCITGDKSMCKHSQRARKKTVERTLRAI